MLDLRVGGYVQRAGRQMVLSQGQGGAVILELSEYLKLWDFLWGHSGSTM